MKRWLALVVMGIAASASSSVARADDRPLKNPFASHADSAAIRALPPAQLKDPFAPARSSPARPTVQLPEARLKDPFARPERPEELPARRLKDPFAR